MLFQPPCHAQGQFLLDKIAQSPIQPALEHFRDGESATSLSTFFLQYLLPSPLFPPRDKGELSRFWIWHSGQFLCSSLSCFGLNPDWWLWCCFGFWKAVCTKTSIQSHTVHILSTGQPQKPFPLCFATDYWNRNCCTCVLGWSNEAIVEGAKCTLIF